MTFRTRVAVRIRTLLGAAMVAVAGGCASLAPSIPVAATPGVLERLSGDWRGEYIGDHDHARQGTIAFKLTAGEDHAHGTVVMTPAGLGRPLQPYRGDELTTPSQWRAEHNRVLAIRFVNADDDTLNGVLEPYWDPDRQTRASTTFRGRLTGNIIEGTFTTTYANGIAETGGRWKVRRTRSWRE